MTGSPSTRRLREDEVEAAASMMADAFVDDPLPVLLSDDPSRRLAATKWALGAFIRYGLAVGEVWTAGNLDGVAVWWAPEYVEPSGDHAALTGLNQKPDLLSQDEWQRFLAFGELYASVHHRTITGPHWYLNAIGVSAEHRGKGVGTALLNSMFERFDRERMAAYLDTGAAENVTYYQRRGFVLVAEALDPRTGVLVRGMRRDPR